MLTALGASILGAGASAGGSLLTSIVNNEYAKKIAANDRKENFQYNEQAADNAMQRQTQLLDKYYTPQAQIKQLKEAGLSPSLMYGAGGSTGTTAAPQGTGAAGIKTGYQPIDLNSLMTAAQIKNLNAQTDKINAETQTELGENERGQADIATKLADAGYKKAAANLASANADLTEIETKLKGIETDIAEETLNDTIRTISAKADEAEQKAIKAMYAAHDEGLQFDFNFKTFDERLNQATLQTKKMIAENANIWADTNLKQNEIYQIVENVKLAYRETLVKENTFKLANAQYDFDKFKFSKEMQLKVEQFNNKLGFEAKKTRTEQITNLIGKILGIYTANALLKQPMQSSFRMPTYDLTVPMQNIPNLRQ